MVKGQTKYPESFFYERSSHIVYESFRCSEKTVKDVAEGISVSLYRMKALGESILKNYSEPEEWASIISRSLRSSEMNYDADWIKRKKDYYIVVVGVDDPSIEGYAFGLKDEKTRFELEIRDKNMLLNINEPYAFRAIQKMIHNRIQQSFISKGYQAIARTVYDATPDLTTGIVQELQELSRLKQRDFLIFTDIVALYPAVSFSFRSYGGEFYLDVAATHKIVSKKTLWNLLEEKWSYVDIQGLGPYLSFEGGGTAYFTRVVPEYDVDTSIEEHPFHGRSYRSYIDDLFPYLERKVVSGSWLLKAVPWGVRKEWTYASCLMRHSLTFETIANKNYDLFIKILNLLKTRMGKRLDILTYFLKELGAIKLRDGTEISFKSEPLTIIEKPLEINFNRGSATPVQYPGPRVMFFRRPELAFRDIEGNEVKVGWKKPKETNRGTLTDLMLDRDLCPYDAPKDIKVVALIPIDYKVEAEELCKNLQEGIPNRQYRGFEDTFKTEMEIVPKYVPSTKVEDYKDIVNNEIKEGEFDSSLVFIPSKRLGREFYSEPKATLFEKKLSSQMITEEPRETRVDRSLMFKASTDEALFNIALQQGAKSGMVACALPEDCAERLSSVDVILGYDVVGVPVIERPELEQEWERKKPRIPQIKLSCPLVIIDPQGANIEYLGVFYIEKTNVFEEYGDDIYGHLPSSVRSFTIHKDGYFSRSEMESMDAWAKGHELEGVAIPIVRGMTPRVHNIFGDKPTMPQKGQTLVLQDDLFVMNTTGYPEKITGWPRPISLKVHPINGHKPNIPNILGQVYAFTEIHSGALRGLRTPITIHFPNLIGRVLRKLQRPLTSEAFTVKTRYGRTPRWFY